MLHMPCTNTLCKVMTQLPLTNEGANNRCLCNMEKVTLGRGLEPNIALGFASCSLDRTLVLFFPYCTRSSVLTSIAIYYELLHN